MTPAELRAYRERTGLTQAALAARIGLGLRTYVEIERGTRGAVLRAPTLLALERASLTIAVEHGDRALALSGVSVDAAALMRLFQVSA